MSTINYSNPRLDPTVKIFDQFYNYEVTVPANEYDIVFSYFQEQMGDARAAGNFTVSLFQVSDQTKIPALTLLQGFQGQTPMEINVNMAYYLNNIRSRATLLGVNSVVVPNFYAARAVIQ